MHRYKDSFRSSLKIKSNTTIESMNMNKKNINRIEEYSLVDCLSSKSTSLRNYKEACDTKPITCTGTDDVVQTNHKQRSQPICFTRKISDSDIQLREDLLDAEYREYCMLLRIRNRNNFGSFTKESTTKTKVQYVNSLEDTWTPFVPGKVDDEFESASLTFVPYLIGESFQFHGSCAESSSSSMPLPSLLSLMDFIPRVVSEEDDDHFDGIFDMEL
jgi:hypothetical protein